eukprot:CAMPEP_0179091008 /NCGR_PEP_ID=MMETSP0796-20121207/41551_1 /TAXON_ID=73915 /ORGANISM="Pyrodinium bahamense, Strain pbaha01" /LENGTH=194 /DNA_ID=CAMNT_0020788591 /DNA_START=139 /DNA_END=723 /DNA_ORIENTATION=+
MSQALADRAPDGGGALTSQNFALFKDVHTLLARLSSESEQIRKTIMHNDEGLRHEIEQIDQDISDEVHERKDSFNKLQVEFESFTHRKVEKVVQELEEFTKEQEIRDGARMRLLLDTVRDMDRLKLHLANISASWGLLSNAQADPTRLPRSSLVKRTVIQASALVGQSPPHSPAGGQGRGARQSLGSAVVPHCH